MAGVAVAPAGRGAPDAHGKPEFEVTGGRGRISLQGVRELWQFREVLGAFVVRQVKVRYKQAALGVGWAVLQPMLAALVFALFLGRLAHLKSEGAPYMAFALAGTVCWSFFSGAAGGAMDSIVTDQAILRKVYFPREIFPLAAVLASLLDIVAGLCTFAVTALALGLRPHLALLALPVPILLLVLTSLALGLGLSAVNVYYRDVRYVLPFVFQLGIFVTPVIYSLSVVPGHWRTPYEVLNPLAAAIDGLRRIALHGTWPQLMPTVLAFAWALLLAAGALSLFKRLERGFADRI